MNDIHGLLVLDKPSGITSRDAVNRVMTWFPKRTKIGHTGTLDPLATGVLVLCLGKATRLAEFVQDMDKAYAATIFLGARSDTDDADGTITPTPNILPIDEMAIRESVKSFVGMIDQTPPAFSAVKVSGRRAHTLARRGVLPNLQPRPVRIHDIDIVEMSWPVIRVAIRCGKGTYIRSLARDLGERLGVGGYIAQLRRTRVGPFAADEGCSLESPAASAFSKLRPVCDAVRDLPAVQIPERHLFAFTSGQTLDEEFVSENDIAHLVAVFTEYNQLIGIGVRHGKMLKPVKILK